MHGTGLYNRLQYYLNSVATGLHRVGTERDIERARRECSLVRGTGEMRVIRNVIALLALLLVGKKVRLEREECGKHVYFVQYNKQVRGEQEAVVIQGRVMEFCDIWSVFEVTH